MQSVYKVSEPTSRELSALVDPLFTVLNLPPGYCQQLDFTCSNLHPGDCPLGCTLFLQLRTHFHGLLVMDTACLYSF